MAIPKKTGLCQGPIPMNNAGSGVKTTSKVPMHHVNRSDDSSFTSFSSSYSTSTSMTRVEGSISDYDQKAFHVPNRHIVITADSAKASNHQAGQSTDSDSESSSDSKRRKSKSKKSKSKKGSKNGKEEKKSDKKGKKDKKDKKKSSGSKSEQSSKSDGDKSCTKSQKEREKKRKECQSLRSHTLQQCRLDRIAACVQRVELLMKKELLCTREEIVDRALKKVKCHYKDFLEEKEACCNKLREYCEQIKRDCNKQCQCSKTCEGQGENTNPASQDPAPRSPQGMPSTPRAAQAPPAADFGKVDPFAFAEIKIPGTTPNAPFYPMESPKDISFLAHHRMDSFPPTPEQRRRMWMTRTYSASSVRGPPSAVEEHTLAPFSDDIWKDSVSHLLPQVPETGHEVRLRGRKTLPASRPDGPPKKRYDQRAKTIVS